jgi:ribosomal protein S18 acetylase RimI-like enzyme
MKEITKLLHKSYCELRRTGFRYLASHQKIKTTKKRMLLGDTFVAIYKDKIAGIITLKHPKNTKGTPWYNRDDVASFGPFAVDPQLQRKGIGSCLLDIVEKRAEELGVRELALDTAEGAQYLIRMYEKRGYRFIEYANWKVTNYRSVILSKTLK